MQTLLLNKNQVRRLIDLKQVIGAVEDAYKAYSSNQVEQPDYIGISLPARRGEIDFKLGYHKQAEIISMKAHSGGFTRNPEEHGVPNSMGTILLFDARSCALICVMDGSLITGLRTGAAGAVSVKALARPNGRVVASIGTGSQARMQIRAINEVIQIQEIHAWPGRTSDDEITIFDSTGMAIQDNTTAGTIYEKAIAANVGTFFSFFEQ